MCGYLIGCRFIIEMIRFIFVQIFPVPVVRFIAIAYLDACNNNQAIVLWI